MVTRIFVTLLVSVNLLAPVNCGYSPAVPATCSAPDPLATTGQAEMFCVPGIADTVWYIDYNDQKTYSEAEEECNRATGDSWKMAWIASSAERQALYDRIKVVSALKKEYVVSLKDVNPSGGGGNRDWQWLTPHQNAAVYMPWLNACSNGGCGDCVTLDCTSDTAACKFKMVNCGQQSYAVLCRHGGATVNNEPTTQAPTTAAPTTTTTVVTTTQAPTTAAETTTQAPTTAAVTTTQAPTTTSAATTTEAETTTMGADCSDPGNITNTNRSPAYQSAGFSEGDTVTYTCDQCSFLEGETSKSFNRTCSNNAWNNERNCSRYSCSPPGNVTNAVRSGTGELCGDNRQYQCYPGFKIWSEGRWSHTHTSTCQADGQWSNPATECVEDPVNLGCVQPTDTSWASSYTTVTGTRTVDACRTHCKDQGMAYSILAYGNRCLCSTPGLSHFNYVTERARSAEYTEDQLFKCNQTCPGSDDSYEYCGNSHEDYYSLYGTMIHTTWQLPSGNGLTTRMSNAADSLNYPEMSPQICSRYCYGKSSNYSYVLVRQWDCYCMEEVDTDLRDIVDKVANCSYNAENCGGTDRVFGYPLSEEPYISSCQDVYNAGLWIHGTYYSSDSSSFYCNIKENSTACDQGWISHGGHCYKLTHVQKNFDQAIQACAADNAHLVTVNSASEMNFLKNLIPTRPSLLYEWYFFIGFYDFADTKASTWLDGALSKYKYFHGVAPNTFGYKCNILMRSQHYKWRDWLCTETEGYICEKSPEYIGCFDRVQDGEVVLTNSKMSIQYCRQTCMAKSYDYAALLNGNACHCVTNDGTNATAFDLHSPLPMTSCSTPCLANDKQYCGAANKFNVYQASGLSSPEYAQSCYELEMAGLPSGEYIIKPSGGSPSTVNCTMESDGLCSVGWIGHNGHCYLFSAGFNSFTNVRAICKARDATMVTLDDVTEGTFLYNVRANVPALYDNSAYWHVGGYATAGYHHYQWNDGRLMKYSTWMSGQPNLHTQLCLAADMQNPPQLLDLRCTDNRHYVCEKYGGYKGCYGVASTSYRVLANIPSLTVQQCIETCRGKNKAFAGLKQKSCYCFDSIVTPTQAHSVCDVACEGGAYQNCGGTGNGMSMYQIDKYPSLADSCEDLYDQGIRISGDYKIQRYGETFIQTCTFYENNPDCPSGFIRWRGECYKFVTSAASWNAANGACLNSGAEMLSILNSEEWDFVQSTLTGIQYNAAKAGWYTGLRDPFGAKQHTWSDGHLLTWKPHSIQGTANQCVQLKRYHTNGNSYNAASYLWTYVSCTTSLPYICKIPRDVIGCVPKPPDSKRTLVKYAGAMSNSLCRQICRGQNSTYAATNANLCTCYNDLTQSERQAVAKAGCSVQCPGNDGQRCGHASPERVTLNDVGVTCPADWVLENDRCYYHDNSTWVKYYDAYLHCRDYGVGGTILSVNTQAESDFSNTLNISDTWIGLSKLTASSSWKWDDGSSASWTNWAANQPGTEKCVTQNETGSWSTTPCSETHPVTCEKPAGSPDALPSTCDNLYSQRLTLSGTYLLSGGHETCGLTDSSRCPDGVSYAFGRSCYEFVLSGRTFESARQHCVSHGKQLYSPDTGEDAAMLRNAISKITELAEVNNWFIGLYDLDLDHHYTTTDGSALFYYNWAASEPRSNYKRCVRWGDTGTWFSEDCATSLPFICETNSGYQGCYNVPSSTSGYRNKVVYPRMTLMTCRKYCRGVERPQLYAGVSGQTCYCMSSLTTSKVADSACDAVCPGNPVQTCGDNGVMTVLVTVMYNIREASCEDLYNQGVVMPGWYRIFPRGHGSMARVYCHGQERANDFLLPSVQDSDIAVSSSEGTTGSGAISYDGSYGRLFQESASLYDAWRPAENDSNSYASVTLPEASYITGFVTRKPLNWLEKFQPATNGFNFPVPELDLSGLTSLTFEVKACKHIGMLLTTSAGEAARGSQGYKIMIDRGGGTSIIQLDKGSEVKVSVTNTKIADCAEYKAFWVSWANGVIRAGAGRRVGTGTIMSWTDSQRRYTVTSLALLTWGSFPGLHWRFPITEPQGLVYAFIRAPDSGASKSHVAGVDLSNSTFLSFSVRGCYNANIMLAESATEAESGTEGYYIIIGGSSGTSASIKRSFSQSGSNAATTTSSRLTNCTEYLSYWVSWRDGLIELGTGQQYGVGAFLNWTDSNPRTVTALAISTKAGSSGIEFEINAPESTQSYSSRLLYGDSENDLTYYDATNDSTQAVTFDGSSVPYQLVYQYLEKPKVAKHVRLEFDNTDRVRFDILGVPLSQFAQDKGHVGCFVESADGTDLDLPFLVGNLPNATACMLSCEAQGYRYAGIAGGVNCSCGTTIGRYGMVKDYECNVQCPNMPGYKCGGTGRNSIYQIWETTCPEVPSVQFATPNTTDRVHNTVVSYTCNPGYIKPEGFYSADKVVTCRQTTWTGELPSPCRPIECNSTVPSLPHSTVNWTDITYLSTATYTCDTGYALPDGSTTHVAHCQISEEWGPLRHCQPVACPATSTFTNNVRTITGTGTSYGSIVTYVCNQGYVVPNTRIMQQRMTCQQWGNWSSTAVDCTADFTFVGCFANSGRNQLNAISIDVSTINDNTVTNYVDKCRKHCLSNGFPIAGMVNGDTCKCAASYDTSASPLPSTSCNTACTGGDPGFWCGGSGTNNIMIFKTANQCPPLTLTLATANTSLHAIGTVVGITCDPGYMFRDTEATTRVTECLANELWSDGVQSCMAIPTTPAPTLATAPLPFTAVDATYETNTNMFWRFDQNSMGFPNEARNGGLLACFDVSNVPVEMKQAGGVCTLTAGVSGYASIGPNNRDCLQMGDLTPKSEALCVVQPDTCAHGVSLSLWVKTPQAHSQTFNKHMLIASVLPGRDSSSTRTGIDLSFHTNIGQNVRYLTFKLTTLSGYYEVQTPWLYWDKWTNLGLRWSQSTGLSAYINGTNVGFVGSPTANTGTVEEATHLTLGCYLNNLQPRGEETGRYEYTAKGVQVDDFAVFLWYLRETELSFFHGGCGVTELNAQPTTAPFDYTSRLELFNWTENVEHEPFYDVATKSYSLESTSGFTVQGTINTVSTARSGATSKSVLELGATSSYLQLENLAGRCAGDIASCTDGMAMAAWLLIPSTVSTSANSLSTIIQCDQRAASGSGRFVGYGVFWENGTLTVRVGKSSSSEGLKFTVNSVPRDVWFNVGFGYHPDFGLSVLVDGDAAAGTASEETAGFTDHQTGTLAPGILVFGGDGGDSLQGALASRVVLWERYVYPCEGDTFLGMNERVVKLTKSASHVWSNLVVDLDGAKTKPLYITNGSSVALVPGSGRMGRAIRVAPDTEGWMVLGKIFSETIDQTVGKFTGSCLSKPSVCNTGLSFNMYLKINAIPTVTGHQYIICSGAQHSQSEGFFISMSGGAIWTYLATNTHTWITKIEASRITTGQWMHVGFSWNPTDGLLTFLNGNVVGSSTTPKAQSRLVDYLDRITIGRSNANDDMEGFEVDFTFEDIAVYEEFVPEYLFRDKFKLPESSYYEDIGSNFNWNPKSMLSSHLADLEDYSLTQSSGRLGAHNQVSYLASGVTISNSLNSSLCSNIKLAAYSSGACLSNPGTACSGFTVALWVKINEVNWEFQGNDTVNNTYTVLRTFTSASQTGFSISLYGQYWQFVVKSEAKDWTVQTSSKMVPVGKWVNVGFTWNAVDGLVAYINGVMEGVHTTGTTASPLNMPANSMLTLGCHSGQDARVVSMKAYSVHVWPMAVLPSNRPFRITGMSDAQIDKFNMNDYYWALDGPISKFSDQQLTTHGGATIQEGDISSGQGVKTTSGGGYASLGNFNGECIKDINVCSSGISVGLYMKLPTTPSGSAAALFNSGGVQIWKDGTSVGVRLYKGTRMYTRVMTNAPVDTWFHFVLQWSPDLVESQSIKFYKDGQEVSGSTSAANVAPSVDNNPVYLGRPFATATIAIDAHFDEITISYTSDFLFTFTDPCFASATSSFGMTSAEQYLAKSGTTPAADRNGKANGAILVQSGYINIGTVSTCLSNPALCPDGFTIAFKVKLKNRGSNNYDYLFSSGYSFQNKEVGGNGLNRGIAIAFKISGVFFQVRAYLNDGTTTWDATVTGVPINQWITIGLTWRRTNTEGLVMLLDDVRKDPPSNAYRVGEPATLPAPATSNVFLARANFIESPSFPGTIVFDSVAFYNQYSNFSDPLTRTILKGESCDSVVTVDTNDVQVTTVTPTPFVAMIPTTVPPSTTAACSPAMFYKGTCYTNRIALFDAMSTNNIESSQRNETALSETLALAIVSDINNETTANSENEPKTATQLSEVALAIRVLATSDLPTSISRQNARDRFQAAMDAVSQNTDASNAENLKQITVANADVASQISNLKKYITRVAEKMPPVTNCSASNTVSQNMVLNMIDVIPECAEETTFPLRESSDVNSTLEGWGQPQDSIVVPPNLIPGASGLTIGVIISNTAHESISNEQAEGETAMKLVKVNSRVIEMFIVPELPSGTTFASPVVFTLEHLDKTASGQRSCNYWKEASGNVKAGWASDGCERNSTNVTHTVCHCYHFTTFAVLLDQDTTEPDHFKLALSIITWVTMAISMGSLIFFIVILVKAWERLLDDRGIADINLAVAIFFASLWFCLLWTAQDHLVYCQALSILMHYFYLTSFAWLVMEAVCLFSIIISGVLSERALKIYMPVAWGVPALVVIGVAVVALPDHGHKERCWLSHETMYFWAFPGAIIAFMVLTALILLVVMCNFSAPAIKKKEILLEVKQTIRNIMLLLLYLGLTWLFGIISLTIPADRALDFTFIIFNGFQGFFFFLTFGVGRNSFRDEVKNTFQKQTAVEDEDIANSRAVSRASNSSTVSLTQVEDIRITPRLKKDNDGWSDGSTDSEEEMAMAKKKKMQARHKAPAYVP